jgi:hypothetical protein
MLAAGALDRELGPAAIGCLLTRSGIPILSAHTGELVNDPARPSFVDAYVYDVQLPMLADSLQDHRTWFLEDLWDLPPILGQELTSFDAITSAVPGWVSDALEDPERPSSFPAIAVRALGLAQDPALDFFSGINPDTFGFDAVQFVIMGASMMSRVGTLEPGEPDPTGCATLAKRIDDSDQLAPALLSTRLGSTGETVRRAISANNLYRVGGDILADLALLAGIDVSVDDDVNGRAKAPPVPNDPAGQIKFRADVQFSGPAAGTTIQCGGLQGIRLPDAGPLPRWGVGWTLVQSGRLANPAGPAEASKLTGPDGVEGHASGNPSTNAGGRANLRITLAPDRGCPDQPTCGEGPVTSGTVIAFVVIDADRAPGFSALLPGFPQNPGPHGNLARRWLLAAVDEIAPPPAIDTIEVTMHDSS